MRRFLCIALAFILCCCSLPLVSVYAVTPQSGALADISWSIDAEGVLTVSGNGAVEEFLWEDTSTAWRAFKGDITKVVVENGITDISDFAFSDLPKLISVSIAGTVSRIGDYAFYMCNALTAVSVPDSVKVIDEYAFNGCSALESVSLGKGALTIGYRAFYKCTSLEQLSVPDSVKTVGESAFAECGALSKVKLGAGKQGRRGFDIRYRKLQVGKGRR